MISDGSPICKTGLPGIWNPTLLIDHDHPAFPKPQPVGLRKNRNPAQLITVGGENDREMLVCDQCRSWPLNIYLAGNGWIDLRALMQQNAFGEIQANRIGMQFDGIRDGRVIHKIWNGGGPLFLRGKICDVYTGIVRDAHPEEK
jgi:hypothetical protein